MNTDPARVLLMVTDSGIGGTEKVVSFLARGLDRRRFRPIVCSVKPPGEMAREVQAAGVEFVSLGFRKDAPAAALRGALLVPRAAREIRRREVDLGHSFLFLANMIGRFAARLTGRPHISSIRVEEREKGYHLLLERLTRSLVDAWLTPSERLADFTAERCGIPRSRIEVIPNPVTPPPPGEPRLRPLLGLGRETFLAGTVGRLHRQKGVDVLLRAWALLPPEGRPVLAVVGDGPERAALEEQARRLGLGDRVRFTGWVPGAGNLLGELDLLFLPSRWEGLPNTVLEAMAAGVPVVAAVVGGVPELVEDGVTGLLVPPDDPQGLRVALARVLADPAGTGRMAGRARERVLRLHDPAVIVRQFELLYDKILRGGTAA